MLSVRDYAKAINQTRWNIAGLLNHYQIVLGAVQLLKVDRVVVFGFPGFQERMEALTQCGLFTRWDAVKNHGPTALCGWREAVPFNSMQLIFHNTGSLGVVELDIDRCNPAGGLFPAIGHSVEVLFPGKTNPFAVYRGLLSRGVEVEQA